MRQLLFRTSIVSVILLAASVMSVAAQDFQKSYQLGAGGSIVIQNVSGDIVVTGYDGNAVIVSGTKEGRDREMVEVEDNSSGNRVEIRVKYPRNCNCDASVRFQVQVPRNSRYSFEKISTASGNIEIKGVAGQLNASTASGDVLIEGVSGSIKAATASGNMSVKEVTGTVSAQSASGNVEVEITRLEGAESMTFSSASGNVSVKMPGNLEAQVNLSSTSGSLRTDFPLEIRKPDYGPGESAKGRLGNNPRTLKISSASGDVSLLRL
jgi:DUF4097 and DUF4098 domain-containing protein YvlB